MTDRNGEGKDGKGRNGHEGADEVPTIDLTSERDGSSRSTPNPFEESTGTDGTAGTDDDDDSGGGSDGDDREVEPVEILVQLAEEGEIEPWDIDIVHVTDAFLAKLDRTDLRTTGRALFYASVLLRMKSDELLAEDDEDEEPAMEPWEAALEGDAADPADPEFDPIDQLEAEMDRRLDRKNTRGSPETLDELVRELREAERDSWWKRSREYDTSESPTGYDRGTRTLDYHAGDAFRRDGEPTAGEATERTHDEDIEDVIDDVEGALRRQFDNGRAEVLFAEVEAAGGRPFMTFLALLFMAHRGSVRLQQDDLFGDLWIRDPNAALAEAEAIAD
ncbi:segregation and condensation protein A [Halorubrum vacuolatum]|uniref:Condensin subunit ScpA n=1 Tax=Halorubrum vacuolatum TaxID=63740 RepID=A0A238VND8_HALVU|nr:ScpA family protein [Halorubrum vacuolatum]SNR35882.1 condensin subunit ScpA [Halorubrum vacuolatum]